MACAGGSPLAMTDARRSIEVARGGALAEALREQAEHARQLLDQLRETAELLRRNAEHGRNDHETVREQSVQVHCASASPAQPQPGRVRCATRSLAPSSLHSLSAP